MVAPVPGSVAGTAGATPVAGGARVARSGVIGAVRARVAVPGWTPAVVCIIIYLFVVHSYKLNIGAAAIGVGLVCLALEGRPLRMSAFLGFFAAYLFWALATIPFGINATISWERWQIFGKIWLITFLITNAARSQKQWSIIVVGWLALFALYPYRGAAYNFVFGYAHAGRFAWNFIFSNPNELAALALFPLAFCVALLRSPGSRWIKLGARIGAVSMPLLILLTGSRGGLLALLVFGAVLLLFSKQRLGIAALVCLAALLAVPFLPERITTRFVNMKFLQDTETIGQADSSAEQRFIILKIGWAAFTDNAMGGVGIGNYPRANEIYAQRDPEWAKMAGESKDAHNAYLTLGAETGVIGLLLMVGAFGTLVVPLMSARSRGTQLPQNAPLALRDQLLNRPPALLAGLAAFHVACFFGSFYYTVFPYLFAACAVGLVGGHQDSQVMRRKVRGPRHGAPMHQRVTTARPRAA